MNDRSALLGLIMTLTPSMPRPIAEAQVRWILERPDRVARLLAEADAVVAAHPQPAVVLDCEWKLHHRQEGDEHCLPRPRSMLGPSRWRVLSWPAFLRR